MKRGKRFKYLGLLIRWSPVRIWHGLPNSKGLVSASPFSFLTSPRICDIKQIPNYRSMLRHFDKSAYDIHFIMYIYR